MAIGTTTIPKALLALDLADNITLDAITGNKLEIKDGGVATAKIATGAVTIAKLDAGVLALILAGL